MRTIHASASTLLTLEQERGGKDRDSRGLTGPGRQAPVESEK